MSARPAVRDAAASRAAPREAGSRTAESAEGEAPGRVVDLVVPAGVRDSARPSGGNRYDTSVAAALAGLGWRVRVHLVDGDWPHPDGAARGRLAAALRPVRGESDCPAPVLIDGLVASGAGDVIADVAACRPLVVLVHMLFGEVQPGLAESEGRALLAAAGVVTTSGWAARRVAARYPVPHSRIHVAPPGAGLMPANAPGDAGSVRNVREDGPGVAAGGTEGATPDWAVRGLALGQGPASAVPAPGVPGGLRLLCVGAVTRAKGHDVLVAALASLTEAAESPALRDLPPGLAGRRGAWTCRCVGSLDVEPDTVAALRDRIASAGLARSVELCGAVPDDALAAEYAAADLLVHPSRSETWGMVLTEALAHGVPVLASDVGGIPEAVGHAPGGSRPGLLVPPGDPQALAAALRDWLEDPGLRARLRVAAQARAGTLRGWDATAVEVAGALEAASREWLETRGRERAASRGHASRTAVPVGRQA